MSGKDAVAEYARLLQGAHLIVDESVFLALPDCVVRIRSSSVQLLERMAGYFAHLCCAPATADIEVLAIECDPVVLPDLFTDWVREAGKTARKDSYLDIPGGRLIRKVRTGMLFLQSESKRVAAGPCLRHDNQLINFINAQYMNRLQQQGWLICHASGLVTDNRAVAIAGFSGGGKSTLMLHMLEEQSCKYLTNDRLFLRRAKLGVVARGIPKLPRINPGTLVYNSRLHGLATAAQRRAWLDLPSEELWHLEEKYDVPVTQVYGAGRFADSAPLAMCVVLNWHKNGSGGCNVARVNLAEREDLMDAIMKSPGPFYQDSQGVFLSDDAAHPRHDYQSMFSDVPVFEVTGKIAFDEAARCILSKIQEATDG